MESLCSLSPDAEALLAAVAKRRELSLRAQHRIRRVARTIDDLLCPEADPHLPIGEEAVAEACALRQAPSVDA